MTRTIRMKDIAGLKANATTAPYATTEPAKIGGVRGGGGDPAPGGGGDPIDETPLGSLPLASQSDLTGNFLGAFSAGLHSGTSDNADSVSMAYSDCQIAVSGNIVYMSGTQGAYDNYKGDPVGGFTIPALVDPSTPYDATELNETTQIIDWSSLMPRASNYFNDEPTTYQGLYVEDGKLYYTAARDYDTSPFSGNHIALASDASDLVNSTINGWYRYGDRNDTFLVGSISKIPVGLQSEFNGDTHIISAGGGAKISINGRLSMGPSLATCTLSDLNGLGQTGDLTITRLLEYPLGNELWAKRTGGQYNATPETQAAADSAEPTPYGAVTPGDNDLWTQMSQTFCSFIVPGTRTVAFIGRSGGHIGGAAYKAVQSNGNQAGGPASCEWEDYDNRYWLYDLSAIKAATSLSELEPYEYGVLTHADNWVRHINNADNLGLMRGGYFDPDTSRMYIALEKRTHESATARPVMLVYQL